MHRIGAIAAIFILGCGSSSQPLTDASPDAGAGEGLDGSTDTTAPDAGQIDSRVADASSSATADTAADTQGDVAADAASNAATDAADDLATDGAGDLATEAGLQAEDGGLVPDVQGGLEAQIMPAAFQFPPLVEMTTSPERAEFWVTNAGATLLGPFVVTVRGTDSASFPIYENRCSIVVQAGASCAVTVSFSPTSAGAKTATLVVSVGSLERTATLSGTGLEAAKLVVTPTIQDFGSVPVGMKASFRFSVVNMGGSSSGSASITVAGDFTASGDVACFLPLDPGAGCSINVSFAPTGPGAKTSTLRVAASPGGTVNVALSGTGISAGTGLTLTAPSANPFGIVTTGQSSSATYVVTNQGPATYGMVVPTINGSNASEFTVTDNACPASLPPGGTCGITVRFQPALPGGYAANLQINAAQGGFAILPVFGTAVPIASLHLTPQSRTFSDRVIGSTSDVQVQTFTVSNSGPGSSGPLAVSIGSSDPTHLSSFELSGVNECANAALPANGTCRVDVRFLPKVRGLLAATLNVSGQPGGVVKAIMTGRGCQGSVGGSNCQ